MLSHGDLAKARTAPPRRPTQLLTQKPPSGEGGAHEATRRLGGIGAGWGPGRARVCVWARTSGVHVCACPCAGWGVGVLKELANASVRTSGMDVCAHVRKVRVGRMCACANRQKSEWGRQRPPQAASSSCVAVFACAAEICLFGMSPPDFPCDSIVRCLKKVPYCIKAWVSTRIENYSY